MLLAKRDIQIFKLEIENMKLKSKLDKFQSIFPISTPAGGGGGMETTNNGGLANTVRKIERAHGISAGPQSLKNFQESKIIKFPELKQEDKVTLSQFVKLKNNNFWSVKGKTWLLLWGSEAYIL